jgi:hypothetical protein
MLLAVSIAGAPVSAQQVSRAELLNVTEDLLRAVDALRGDTIPASLVADAGWLHDSVHRPSSSSGPPVRAADVSRAYVQSLQVAVELLRRKPSQATLQAVAEDLQDKVEHCRRLGIGMGGTVRVTVHTRRGAEPVPNHQVRYLLKFFEVVTGAQPGTFPRFSTPTEMTLEPGRYWVWAIDPATGRESPRTLVKVAGARELTVDVPVP